MDRPFSQACENNKGPILSVIKQHFAAVEEVLEIGSGTGQHAVYFAEQLPHLVWQPTDQHENLSGIQSWISWAALHNLREPLELDVNQAWPVDQAGAVYSANTLHIMSWPEVESLFSKLKSVLRESGILCVYGPFNRKGGYTSDSNARFDQWLKQRDPLSGIRDFEAVHRLASNAGLELIDDRAMPANNSCIVFRKK
jgi:cyclopropane fatty-acyl-phospholipid synthase-like methyltransferase